MDRVFDGCIAGIGTTSGHRFVVGLWTRSPYGSFCDVMHEDPGGRRVLLAPTREVVDFIARTYRFDEQRVVAVSAVPQSDASAREVVVTAGGLRLALTVGRRSAIGWLLRAVPRPLATSPAWVSAIDAPARVVLRGVRTRGTAGGGRREWYAALDHHVVAAARASLDGVDLGGLAEVRPAVRFGFGSVPVRPSLTRVVTTVRVPDADAPGQQDRPEARPRGS